MKIIGLIFIFSAFIFLPAFSQNVIWDKMSVGGELIGKNVFVLMDSTEKMSIEQVLSTQNQALFQRSEQAVLSFGNDKKTVWVKFSFQNKTDEKLSLEISQAIIPKVEFYYKDSANFWQVKYSGHDVNLIDKEIKSHWQLFDLPSSGEIYIKMEINAVPVPIKIWKKKAYEVKAVNQKIIYGIYVGIMLFIMLHNIFLSFSFKNYIYFYYAVLTFSYTVFSALTDGYIGYFIYQGDWSFWIVLVSIINQPNGFLYGLLFLDTKKYTPFSHKVAMFFLIYFMSYIFWYSFLPIHWVTVLNQIHALLGILFMIGLGISVSRKGNRVGYYFSGAYFVMFIIASMEVIYKQTGSPAYFFEISHVSTAIFIEVFMLAYILSKRFEWEKQLIEQEKLAAQNLVILQIKENERIVREQNTMLEQKVAERTAELNEKNEEILQQHEELSVTTEKLQEQHELLVHWQNDIKASINYAKRIQDTFLPQPRLMKSVLEDYFLFFRPKDIVSGDFYWLAKFEDIHIIVVADCTGHGVPGAFMSLLGANLLDKIVNEHKIKEPDQILNYLKRGIRLILNQENSSSQDGMDIAICAINKSEKYLDFASAKRPLIYFQREQLFEIKGDTITIGGTHQLTDNKLFSKHRISFEEVTSFYMFSDGYVDQFGGKERKKFMIKNFRNLLQTAQAIEMPDQEVLLEKTLNHWMLQDWQIDDILVIGFKLGGK